MQAPSLGVQHSVVFPELSWMTESMATGNMLVQRVLEIPTHLMLMLIPLVDIIITVPILWMGHLVLRARDLPKLSGLGRKKARSSQSMLILFSVGIKTLDRPSTAKPHSSPGPTLLDLCYDLLYWAMRYLYFTSDLACGPDSIWVSIIN